MDVPEKYSRDDLRQLLDDHKVDYDFIYLPFDWGDRNSKLGTPNRGYAFVNCTSHSEALSTMKKFEGFKEWKKDRGCGKTCDVKVAYVKDKDGTPGKLRRGLREHIEHYRDNPVMHPMVKPEHKPAIYSGPPGKKVEMKFPGTTIKLKKPRNLKGRAGSKRESK